MIDFSIPIGETAFYKEIFNEGVVRGKIKGEIKGEIKGINGKIEGLAKELESYRDFHEKGYLPDEVFASKAAELEATTAQLKARLAELGT